MFNFKSFEAMRFKTIALFVGGLVLFISCSNIPKNSSNGNFFDGYSSDEANNSEYVEQVQLVTCPMCNGTGIFDFMPGDVMAPKQTCGACSGSGVCDASTAQQIGQLQEQINSMNQQFTNEFSTLPMRKSRAAIQMLLDKAYELLQSMQTAYDNSSSVVLKTLYPRMIAEQKERIRKLEEELRNAQ